MIPTNELSIAQDDLYFVTFPVSQLTNALGCALCKGILRDAHTIQECLHSFCKSCISRHFLILQNRQCPRCHLQLKPHPITLLVPDYQLQSIVDKIFPEYALDDQVNKVEFYKINGFTQMEKTSTKTNIVKNNTFNVITPTFETQGSDSCGNTCNNSKDVTQVYGDENKNRSYLSSDLEIQVLTADSESLPDLQCPYLMVEGHVKVSDISKLIRKQLGLDELTELEITCLGAIMGPELSIYFIWRTIWQHVHSEKSVVLQYDYPNYKVCRK